MHAQEIIAAVAHIGVDTGCGVFELNEDHIKAAREIYEMKAVECKCGDTYGAQSYGAGYIHACGMCPNCHAAVMDVNNA